MQKQIRFLSILVPSLFSLAACQASSMQPAPSSKPPSPQVPKAAEHANAKAENADKSQAQREARAFCLKLEDEQNQPVRPTNVLTVAKQIYFLTPRALYTATIGDDSHFFTEQKTGGYLNLKKIEAPLFIAAEKSKSAKAQAVPVQEFTNFLHSPARKSLVLLDKSGDLYEYFPATDKWQLLRANTPISGSPDPEFIDFCLIGSGLQETLCLLDPERNQIWQLKLPSAAGPTNGQLTRTFKEVMPWRLTGKDVNVAQSIGVQFENAQPEAQKTFFILKQSGLIGKIQPLSNEICKQSVLTAALKNLKPSRFAGSPGSPLIVVERQKNRVQIINKSTASVESVCFPQASDLRGLTCLKDGFWIINGSQLQYVYLNKNQRESMYSIESGEGRLLSKKLEPVKLESRLQGLIIPVPRAKLPKHAGVYPGARRLYRYGVHEGLDFFNDCGPITMGTPARAAASGKIVRVDSNFQDMNSVTFNKVMRQCLQEHRTSDHNEDLFRGCQVWIDHGNNMVTKYAHLDKVNDKLKVGQTIKAGDYLGYIGVSGTGQNLPGRKKYPHLHFEIWLDNHYLGWGLTPPETLGLLEDIFQTKE